MKQHDTADDDFRRERTDCLDPLASLLATPKAEADRIIQEHSTLPASGDLLKLFVWYGHAELAQSFECRASDISAARVTAEQNYAPKGVNIYNRVHIHQQIDRQRSLNEIELRRNDIMMPLNGSDSSSLDDESDKEISPALDGETRRMLLRWRNARAGIVPHHIGIPLDSDMDAAENDPNTAHLPVIEEVQQPQSRYAQSRHQSHVDHTVQKTAHHYGPPTYPQDGRPSAGFQEQHFDQQQSQLSGQQPACYPDPIFDWLRAQP